VGHLLLYLNELIDRFMLDMVTEFDKTAAHTDLRLVVA